MNVEYENIIILLKYVVSNAQEDDDLKKRLHEMSKNVDWNYTHTFFSSHGVVPLTVQLIQFVPEEFADLINEWKQAAYSNVYASSGLIKKQTHIIELLNRSGIAVVVLKGTTAARYYPKPVLRSMGDIDLLVKPEDFNSAVKCLKSIGCSEETIQNKSNEERHRSFQYMGVVIELHRYFSTSVNRDYSKILDDLIFEKISSDSSMLPDDENGLVLLAHIAQHLEAGIGLRQIIDWFMFVKVCLDDEMWYSSFQEKARKTGLEALAITVTKMCQIHLGLTTENITWCKDADETLCDDLIKYVIECGNFGRNREILQSTAVERFPKISHPIRFMKYIQSRGERNWETIKMHPYLKPFAWVYQSCRYIKLAFQNKVGTKKLKAIYNEGNKRNEMFAALGLK